MPKMIKDGSTVRQKVKPPVEGIVTSKHISGDKIIVLVKPEDGDEIAFDSDDLEVIADPKPPADEAPVDEA